MKVVIAMDSFKGSISSLEAANAVSEGIRRAHPEADIVSLPLADGGEGTVDALIAGLGAERISAEVSGPLGETVTAEYGLKDGLAVMEMAAAAGLPLVPCARDAAASSWVLAALPLQMAAWVCYRPLVSPSAMPLATKSGAAQRPCPMWSPSQLNTSCPN